MRLTIDGDGIAFITLDHATESKNLVSAEWIDEMAAAIERAAEDPAVKGVVVTSAKSDFMAGADLKLMAAASSQMSLEEAFELSQHGSRMHRRLETCGKPFVAAINGLALGGGFELCLACHHRILVDDPGAVVGLPEVTVGLLPGSGGTQRLPRMVGVERALPFLLHGTVAPPQSALQAGLVDQVVPASELISSARRALLEGKVDASQPWDRPGFAPKESLGLVAPGTGAFFSVQTAAIEAKFGQNYPAPISILSAVFEGMQLPFERALTVESRYFARLLVSPVARNIIRTTFINKKAAGRLASRPSGVAKQKVAKLGVIGAGMMGAGIAFVAAAAGIEVVLIDETAETARRGKEHSVRLIHRGVERGRLTPEAGEALLARIHPTIDYSKLTGCSLVVEAVFEDGLIKAAVTGKAERIIPPSAIFASNTSTLPISRLASASGRPENFIGLHFFSPVDRMDLVEVIIGKQTSKSTLARALDFVAQLRKTPIIVNDSRGFYTSRVFQTFTHEGAAMLGEGILPVLIENAARDAGFPVGPLALLDETTLELPLKIIEQTLLDEGSAYQPLCGTPVLQHMTRILKRPGRRGGGGFYTYPPGAPKHLWAGLSHEYPPRAVQPAVEELKRRFLYIQALEAARCLEEGVILHPSDADLGAVLGWSFPSWTGGPLSLIDTIGIVEFVKECEGLSKRIGPRFEPTDWLKTRAAAGKLFHNDPIKTVSCAV